MRSTVRCGPRCPPIMLQPEIAVLRFGLGARPGDLAAAASDPRAWLRAQTRGPAERAGVTALAPSNEIFEAVLAARAERREERLEAATAEEVKAAGAILREAYQPHYRAQVLARAQSAALTMQPFARAPGPFLGQSFRGLCGQGRDLWTRRNARERSDPAARERTIRAAAHGRRAASRDDRLSRQSILRGRGFAGGTTRRRASRCIGRSAQAALRYQREPRQGDSRASHPRCRWRIPAGRRDELRADSDRLVDRRRPGAARGR